jgi:twinkle protein
MAAGFREGIEMLIDQHRQWLEARGFTEETITKFDLHTHSDGRSQWLRVPFVENGVAVNHKWRKTVAKIHRMDTDAPLLLFNPSAVHLAAHSAGKLIITEGEWDALIALQCGWEAVTSVPNGAPQQATEDVFDARRYDWFQRHRKDLDRISQFVLATDGDDPGRLLAADLARLLGPERCMFVDYPAGTKDLNDVFLKLGEDAVSEVLALAKPYPVAGLYTFEDFPEPPPFTAVGSGIEGLEDLWPVVPGTLSVVIGYPGHGKSSAVLCAAAHLVKQGMPLAVGSFETMVKPVLLKRLRACYYQCDELDRRVREHGAADDVFKTKLRIITNLHVTEETELTIEAIIELATVAVIRDGIRLLILDPWNEIEHKRMGGENETDYTGRAIRMLKRFARDFQCAVWLVVHPRKFFGGAERRRPDLGDASGSQAYENKADYGVSFWRTPDDFLEAAVIKKRMGLPGAYGQVKLIWREATSSYEKAE